jgi:hypothetical protein
MAKDAGSDQAQRLKEILSDIKALAVEYYQLTGKPLGVTGEVAEYVVAQTLGLELAPPRTPGYDATRMHDGKAECVQIKGRAFKSSKSQKLSKFNTAKPCDVAMMALLDIETLDAQEIWEAPFSAVVKRLGDPGSKARGRGVLSVGDFKRIGTRIYPTIGILAYGSLIEEPGPEIEAARQRVITNVVTPFNVEFARKSQSRGDAPTLVPVQAAGAQVPAQIIILNDRISEARANDMLWRRETRNIGTRKRYVATTNPGKNKTVVKRLEKFEGVDVVIYTEIGTNIEPLTAETLARLAVDSVAAAKPGMDGISYLIAALARGTKTPLSDAYAEQVKQLAGVDNLDEALRKSLSRH